MRKLTANKYTFKGEEITSLTYHDLVRLFNSIQIMLIDNKPVVAYNMIQNTLKELTTK